MMRMNCGLCIENGEERAVCHIRVSFNNCSIALLVYLFLHSLQSEFLFLLFITEIDAHLECMSVETHRHKSVMVYSASEPYSLHNLYSSALNRLPWWWDINTLRWNHDSHLGLEYSKETESDSCFACVQSSMTYLYRSVLSGVSST